MPNEIGAARGFIYLIMDSAFLELPSFLFKHALRLLFIDAIVYEHLYHPAI